MSSISSAPIGPAPAPFDFQAAYQSNFDNIASGVNKAIDELIEIAQGDYDFAAKWIENEYKLARGEDDKARAEFLKTVANELEKKVGRIQFDYETGTYRLNQDADIATQRTIQGRDIALARLDEDDRVYRRQFAEQIERERDEQNASLNQRGLVTAAREQQTGLGGKEIRALETNISDRLSAYERELGRTKHDISLKASQGLEDIGLTHERGLQDLTTTARRSALDADFNRNYSLEEAQRALERQKAQLEMQRKSKLDEADAVANLVTQRQRGY